MAEGNTPLTVLVMNHKEVLFKGAAENLTSVNDTGEFDVLSQHANFISLIKDKLIVRKPEGEEWKMSIKGGVLRVHDNKVRVFLDVGTGE